MTVTIYQGDALAVLKTLPAAGVQTCVTSPPYYALRNYGAAGQIGLEGTLEEYLGALWAVFDEVKRVLRPDGTCWVNLGDSYAGSGKGPTGGNGIGDQEQRQGFTGGRGTTSFKVARGDDPAWSNSQQRVGPVNGIPAKNLLLVPERFAIGMQERGWYVRSRVAWCKTAAMPESVKDRPSSAWEHVWLFSKARTYYYDAEAVRQPAAREWIGQASESSRWNADRVDGGKRPTNDNPAGANLRNYWLLGPEPSKLEHWASFPTEIPKRCILAGTSERGGCRACGAPWVRETERGGLVGRHARPGQPARLSPQGYLRADGSRCGVNEGGVTTLGWQPSCRCDAGPPTAQTVLDPFAGSGTSLLVADRLGRNANGIELNPAYAQMARRRVAADAGFLADVTVRGTA